MKTELANGCYSIKSEYRLEYYNQHGKLHREDGPAIIAYNKDGSINYEYYLINHKQHREDGPSYIGYTYDGSIYYEEHFLYGKYITKEEFNDQRFVTQLHLEKI